MRLICNSIPKSGTYLLAAIARLCGFDNQRMAFVDTGINVVDERHRLVEFVPDMSFNKISRLNEGCYSACHLTYSDDLAKFLGNENLHHIFIYRHPGEVLHSYVKYVTYSETFYAHSGYAASLQTRFKSEFDCDEDRIVHVFQNMRHYFNFFENIGWLDSPKCLPVRFESLYVDVLGLEQGEVGATLQGILGHLEVQITSPPMEIFQGVFGQGPTYTDSVNKVSSIDLLDKSRLGSVLHDPDYLSLLQHYGYTAEG